VTLSKAVVKGIEKLEISDESLRQFAVYEALLRTWSAVKNLVSRSSLDDIWERHLIDSAQVQRAAPAAIVWVDLGSGAGFPGLVTAILLSGIPDARVHLIESDHRKCAFLRDVSRETGCNAVVHNQRIEDIISSFETVDAVSARALAPLPQLIDWCDPLLKKGALAVFPKGREVDSELTGITTDSRFNLSTHTSIMPGGGSLVLVRRRFSETSGENT
jgi:16S rRNA (guanine527-N7)-methyltransferase